ncbi:glycosyl hydrolase family 16 [Flavobacterium sp.]|uniref:glycosyl hydrolase family 16 n=1 Tax=Flavobacterium sp. TaxID=239 RepID=UPI00286E40E6|nr:glycosyl hydrolase family 16 [Flavobacterium sp.]
MKSNFNFVKSTSLLMIVMFFSGCEKELNELEEASFPINPEVFIDGFSPGLNYASFGGAVPSAFQVDNKETYSSSSASMRFDVPNVNDPSGAYAGGSFFTSVGRDLSGYDALTFWARSSKAATIDVVGFGNDFGANKYQASISGLTISTAWKKYIIPISDASKLKAEKGMFFISEGPEGGLGYTFWIDDVKFEKLGTVAHGKGSIFNGVDKVETSFIGVSKTVDALTSIFNLPNGINQQVAVTPAYFVFTSSDTSVATVDDLGKISIIGSGTTKITAKLGGSLAIGSLTINSSGAFINAPTPTRSAASVISIFSETYPNVPVDYYNGYYAPFQTTQSADFTVGTDNVLNYTNFNFVGIQFSAPTINATLMSHLHLDIFIPRATPLPAGTSFKIEVNDWGPDAAFGGGNDVTGSRTYFTPTLVSQNWISLDIPLSSLAGLTRKINLAQIILSTTNANISTFYADNIYFYNDGSIIPAVPTTAAPTPSVPAANVTSIFSDAYTNVAGSNLNPNWGQATITTQVPVAGNNTLKYAGLNYQGLQIGSSQNVSTKNFLHLDYYTANSTSLKVYLISTGPVERPFTLTVPSSGVGGWRSIDIPLSAFAPVNMSDVIQLKFDGNGDIYLDNIYFRN